MALALVQQCNHLPGCAWQKVQELFSNRITKPPGDNFTWVVEDDLEPGSGYALWLDGEGYADLSQWFEIEDAEAASEFAGGAVQKMHCVGESRARAAAIFSSMVWLTSSSVASAST